MTRNPKTKEAVLFIRVPQWLHQAVAREADTRGLTSSAVAREVLVARFADAMKKAVVKR
jgi:hypothetical protein